MNKAIENIWNTISFPTTAFLNKPIFKKLFLENAGIKANDKKLFQKNVKNVYWKYTLKPLTCPVRDYRDNEREYLEVAVLQVEMNSRKDHKRIAEIIHRVIPYPLMLGFCIENTDIALSIAPKRFSQTEHGAFVAERFYTTNWINSEELDNQESAFIASLAWNNMPLQTYGTLYNAWTDCFIGYECSLLSGLFTIGKAEDRLDRLTQYREIESRISKLRRQLNKAAFNRKVELNIQIKKFEQELKKLAASL